MGKASCPLKWQKNLRKVRKLGPSQIRTWALLTSKLPCLALWLCCLSVRQAGLAPLSADVSLWAQWDLTESLTEAKHTQGNLACSAFHRKPGCGVGRGEGTFQGPAEPFGETFLWFRHPKSILHHGDSPTLLDMESLVGGK